MDPEPNSNGEDTSIFCNTCGSESENSSGSGQCTVCGSLETEDAGA